ncbi:MAG: hypothetical protein ABTR07_12160 [Candidatus Competibacter denitrificans]
MLPLDNPRWATLIHAYGPALDVPGWLNQLATLPSSEGQTEPWFSIWSAMAHQGHVFDSSYAAVPHVIAALATNPKIADMSFFHFPVWVEICRKKGGPQIPPDLERAYLEALQRLPALVAEASYTRREDNSVACLLAAIAAAHGHTAMAEAALELNEEIAGDVLEWIHGQ